MIRTCREFTISQKYIFNVYQIITSCWNSTVFWRGHRQKYRSKCTKTRHSSENFIFSWEGAAWPISRPFPWWGGVPPPNILPLALIKPSESAPASPRIPARFTPLTVKQTYNPWDKPSCYHGRLKRFLPYYAASDCVQRGWTEWWMGEYWVLSRLRRHHDV